MAVGEGKESLTDHSRQGTEENGLPQPVCAPAS